MIADANIARTQIPFAYLWAHNHIPRGSYMACTSSQFKIQLRAGVMEIRAYNQYTQSPRGKAKDGCMRTAGV